MSLLPNQADVDAVIAELSEAHVTEHERAFPAYGTIKALVEQRTHPLRVLYAIVNKLAAGYGKHVSPELLKAWEDGCGHRTDEDLEEGYLTVLKSFHRDRMPSPGEFLSLLPALRKRRDGKPV